MIDDDYDSTGWLTSKANHERDKRDMLKRWKDGEKIHFKTFRERKTNQLVDVKYDSLDYFGERRIGFVFKKGCKKIIYCLYDNFIDAFEYIKEQR